MSQKHLAGWVALGLFIAAIAGTWGQAALLFGSAWIVINMVRGRWG